ncbi:uracil-DNA glycosylase family protein [Anabaena sp. UHCC 0204]|uniref:uracil-DNA glycosylase n=1 Tax=Anabaena sp. UHCC 0204 TaxID=2590009 RepID=UPI0014460CC7|nr:uracil-DNA glycosylase [Anabaena sp. UHCC 0204]MTJ09524.1 uracil-DNA glycosylase [Anabaena sp. UHCC 0204]
MQNETQLSLFDDSSLNQQELIPRDAKIPIPSGTYANIEDLGKHCNICQRCALAQNRTHAVVGRGNLQAEIMIIGEAPGKNEDETGLPFVGRSGQLLENILASVKLSTEKDIYIANICKCRPPENRVPSTEEAAACKPYLFEQIRLVDPKIILLTGATSVKGVIGDKRPITKIRGQWIEWEGRLCMPIFHPSYLLRNPSREQGKPKWLMWQDIQAVRSKFDELQNKDKN